MSHERRVPATGILRLNVEVDDRDVIATWTETAEFIVRGDGVDVAVEADELFLTSEPGRRNGGDTIELELPAQPIRCHVKVRHGDVRLLNSQGKLDVEADSGDVSVNGGKGSLTIASGKGDTRIDSFSGEITLNSGSGDKSLTQIDGEVTIRSGKGDVHLTGGRGRAIIASASGDVHIADRICSELTLAGASGDVTVNGGSLGGGTVSTASGDIHCNAGLDIANYDFNASSGDISISIPPDLPARIDAATTRGNVTTDLPLVAIAQRGPRNPHGKRLVGSTSNTAERADITLRTSSGDIDIRWSAHASPRIDLPKAAAPDGPVETSRPAVGVQPAPESSATSEGEPATAPSTSVETTDSGRADADDRKRAILSALADGAITIDEATHLLDALDRSTTQGNGR